MGIFSSIGKALSNPEFQDKLSTAGQIAQGDPNASGEYLQRAARRRAAEEIAAAIEAAERAQAEEGRARLAAASVTPETNLISPQAQPNAYDLPGLAPDGPTRQTVAPPVAVAASELPMAVARPPVEAVAPMSSPMAQALPQAPTPSAPAPRSIYAEQLPSLIRASGMGVDVSGLMGMLQTEEYIRSLPQKDQAQARAMGAGNYSNAVRADSKPVYNETTPGNTWGRYDPATGAYQDIYTAPNRPEPVTTDRVIGAIVAKRAQGLPLTPDEQAIYSRWENGTGGNDTKPPGTSQIVAAVIDKVRQFGVESLNPGERAIWDRYYRGGDNRPAGGDLASILSGNGQYSTEDEEVPTAPAAAPAGRGLPRFQPQHQTPARNGPPKPSTSPTPPVPGAVKGVGGFWYVKQGTQWFRVDE